MRDDDEQQERPKSALRKSSSLWPGVLTALVLAALALGGYLWWQRRSPPEPPSESPAQITQEAPPPVEPDLDPKEQTDPMARDALSRACGAAGVARWLATDDLLRRIASAVESVSRGQSPAPPLDFLAPEGSFSVRSADGRLHVDPKSYARYDAVAATLGGIDVQRCAGAYRELAPMLERAYREVGPPDGTFAAALAQGIHRLTSVPVPEADPELVQERLLYVYADPRLEELPPADKHLLRMGPRNMRVVQQALRGFAEAVGLPKAD